jgi:hypothetical protein
MGEGKHSRGGGVPLFGRLEKKHIVDMSTPDPDQQCMEKTECRERLLIKKYKLCPLPSSALPLVTGSPSPDPMWARISKKTDNFKFIWLFKTVKKSSDEH